MADGADNFTIRIDNSKLMQDAANSTRIIQSISDAAEQSGKRMDESIRIDGNRFSSDAAHVNREIANIGDQAASAGTSIESAFKKAGAAIGIAFSVEQVKSFAGELLNARANMESLQTSFEVLLGNKEKGKEFFGQLRDFGANTPLELPDLSKDAQTLLGFGIQAKDVMGILKDIGNISMGDAQKMESLTLAFAQATSAGKLQGQDLLQMINAGFNPLQEIAARTGKTIAEVKDEMSKGAISADMLRQAFADAAGAGGKFDGMLDKQSKNLRGAKSNLDDAIEMTYNDIGEKLEPAVMTGINLAQTMVEHWEQIGKALIDIVAGWGTYKAAVMLVSAVQTAAINQQIAGYQALLPAKQASMDADLQELVTKGRVSQSRAMELQAIRQEIATKIREMQVTLQQANIELQASRAKYQAATRDLVVARQRMAVAQSQMRIAIAGGNAEEIAAAKTAAATAKKEVQTAAIARNSASKALNTATTNRNSIATELDTLQTNANAVAKKGAATATTILTLATNGLTKAWQALKLAFMSNPIGAAITIALTAITTFMTLKDLFADTGEEAQRQVSIAEQNANDFKQKVGDAVDDTKAKIRKLNDTIHDSNATYAERKRAIADMQKIVPSYHASITREGRLFNDNSSAINTYISNLDRAARAEAAYQLQVENNKRILKLEQIASDADSKASATMSNFQKRTGYSIFSKEDDAVPNPDYVNEQAEQERGWVDKFNKRASDARKQINELKQQNKKLQQVERQNGGHSEKNESFLNNLKNTGGTGGGSGKNKKTGKTGKTGHTGSTGTGENTAQKRMEETIKEQEEERQQAVKNQEAIDQAIVDAMADGEKKRLEQARVNHQKTLDQLDEEQRQLYNKQVENAKKQFANNPKNKGKNFYDAHPYDEKTGTYAGIAPLTNEQTKGIDAKRQSENLRYGKEVQDILQQELDDMLAYYKEFGTLEEQRYAIAKEYDEKIAKATTEGQKKSLQAQKAKELASADAKSMAMGIDWSQTFEGIGNVLGTVAKETLSTIEDYMKTQEFKNLRPSDQKAYTDLRQQLLQETGGEATSPFNFKQWGDIAKQVKEYQESVRSLTEKTKAHREAVSELEKANKKLASATTDDAKKIAQDAVDAATMKVQTTGKDETEQAKDTQAKRDKLTSSTEKATNGMKNFANALQEINGGSLYGFANGITKLITGLGGASKSLGELGGKVGGIIGAILQILDALGDDPKGFINGLFEKITNTVETILEDLPELVGSIIKDVGSLIMGVVEGIGSMFGAKDGWINGSNAKEVKKITEELTKSNDALRTSIDNLKDSIDRENGVTAITDTQKALEAQQRLNENTLRILETQMGYHGSHHSNAHYWNLSSEDYSQINAVLAAYEQRNPNAKTTTNAVYSLGDIYKLTPEQMNEIRTNLADVWTSMLSQGKYDKSEYWEKYADLADKLNDITQTLAQKLTGISFDSMHDNFVSNLMDMSRKASDWTKDLNKQFAKSILNFAIGTQMDERLKKWWQNWAETMQLQSGNLTKDQIDQMRKQYEAFVTEGQGIRDRVFKITGYDEDSGYSQDSSKSVLEGVTQDEITETNGRLSSIQINIDKIADSIQQDYEQNGNILLTVGDIKSLMNDLMDMQQQGLDHLKKIEQYTSELPTMNEKLEKIRKNTERL